MTTTSLILKMFRNAYYTISVLGKMKVNENHRFIKKIRLSAVLIHKQTKNQCQHFKKIRSLWPWHSIQQRICYRLSHRPLRSRLHRERTNFTFRGQPKINMWPLCDIDIKSDSTAAIADLINPQYPHFIEKEQSVLLRSIRGQYMICAWPWHWICNVARDCSPHKPLLPRLHGERTIFYF